MNDYNNNFAKRRKRGQAGNDYDEGLRSNMVLLILQGERALVRDIVDVEKTCSICAEQQQFRIWRSFNARKLTVGNWRRSNEFKLLGVLGWKRVSGLGLHVLSMCPFLTSTSFMISIHK